MVSCCYQTCVVARAARLFHLDLMVQGVWVCRSVGELVCVRWPSTVGLVFLDLREPELLINLAHPCQKRSAQEVVVTRGWWRLIRRRLEQWEMQEACTGFRATGSRGYRHPEYVHPVADEGGREQLPATTTEHPMEMPEIAPACRRQVFQGSRSLRPPHTAFCPSASRRAGYPLNRDQTGHRAWCHRLVPVTYTLVSR